MSSCHASSRFFLTMNFRIPNEHKAKWFGDYVQSDGNLYCTLERAMKQANNKCKVVCRRQIDDEKNHWTKVFELRKQAYPQDHYDDLWILRPGLAIPGTGSGDGDTLEVVTPVFEYEETQHHMVMIKPGAECLFKICKKYNISLKAYFATRVQLHPMGHRPSDTFLEQLGRDVAKFLFPDVPEEDA